MTWDMYITSDMTSDMQKDMKLDMKSNMTTDVMPTGHTHYATAL